MTIVFGVAGLLLAGCADDLVISRKLSAVSGTPSGLVYGLPKGRVQLTAQRRLVTATDVAKAKAAASEAADAAKTTAEALATAEEDLTILNGTLNAAGATPPIELVTRVTVATAKVAFLTRTAADKKKIAALTKAQAERTADLDGTYEESATITTLPVIADTARGYIASINHSPLRSDKLKLAVANGLLSTTTASSADETKTILTSLASLIGVVALPTLPPLVRPYTYRAPARPATPEAPAARCELYAITEEFDPTDRQETIAALSRLSAAGSLLTVEVDGLHCTAAPRSTPGLCPTSGAPSGGLPADAGPPLPDSATGDPGSLGQTEEALARGSRAHLALSAGDEVRGLVYRVPRPVRIAVAAAGSIPGVTTSSAPCELASPPPTVATTVMVPDSTASFVLPAQAGGFTSSTIGHVFKDGMPTEYSVDRPSEVAGALGIPVEVLKAAISVPAELIKVRVNYDSEVNALIEAQTQERQKRKDLLEAQRALDAAQRQAPTAE
ncbi:hypothetical protein [Azospirillum agricola]|uniref:hypothetical protein n=1 Tax=Azospirillum agricola TaxID=1720247 RepID=UPI000A1CA77E|nr:hypothetical protein [Azospirillum agricola]